MASEFCDEVKGSTSPGLLLLKFIQTSHAHIDIDNNIRLP